MVLHTHKQALQALFFRKLQRSSPLPLLLGEDDDTLFPLLSSLDFSSSFYKWQAAPCHTQILRPPLNVELLSTLTLE